MARHRREQIRGLLKEGWDVTAIADYHSGEDIEIRMLGATAIHIPCEGSSLNPAKNALYAARLTNCLRHLKPDLVHAFSPKATIASSLAVRAAGLPLVATMTGQGVLGGAEPKAAQKALRRLFRAVLPARAQVIFQNQDDQRDFIAAGLVPQDRTHYIPGCGVDVARLAAPVERCNPHVFVHASRLLHSKGVLRFIDAASVVKNRAPHAQFWLFGGCAQDYGSRNPDFIPLSELEELTASNVVRWFGRVPPKQVEAALRDPQTAAAVLLSTYAEGVPRFLIEAAACGLPIITTDHAGCRDIVIKDVSGYLCPPGPLLGPPISAMMDLLAAPGRVEIMGDAGRLLAMQFDAGRVVADTLKVYEAVL
jgi:glycosyltransferase involved in cell wall biosynthesis